jgi:hypothetical protein
MADDTSTAATGTAGVPPASFDAFKAQAETLYDQTRDEAKVLAVLLMAKALGEAYYAGQTYVIDRSLLALTPPMTERQQ